MKKLPLSIAVSAALLSNNLIAENKLEEVVVTSSRVEVPLRQVGTSLSLIKSDELELRGYSSLTDVLRTQPGISATSSGGAGSASSLRIRGEEGYRTLVMIDGVEVSDPTGTQVGPQIQHLTVSSGIDRVEVLRGPQGFIYGADAGGVVNVFTRSGESDPGGAVFVEHGRYDSSKVDGYGAAGNDSADVFVSYNHQKTNGFNARVSDEGGEADGYENTTAHGKFGWNINSKLRAQLVARDTEATNEFDRCFGDTPNDCVGNFDRTTSKLSLAYDDDFMSHSIAASRTNVDRKNIRAGVTTFATEGDIEKYEYLGHVNVSESLAFVVGADKETENVDVSGGDDLNRDQVGVFSEAQLNIDDALYFTAGARYDDNDDFGKHTSVRLSAAYVASLGTDSTLKLRGSYGTGFRAPSLSEIAYNANSATGVAADTVLEEETSKGFDIGVEYYHSNGAYVELTYFNQEIEDEIFFDLVGFTGYLQTPGDSTSTGVELAVEYPVADFLVLLGNATYNDTEDSADEQRARRPETQANLGFRLNLLGDRLNVITNYRFARDSVDNVFGQEEQAVLDDYQVLDISASYALDDYTTVSIRGENLTDEDYQEIGGFNASSAAVYAGIKLSF